MSFKTDNFSPQRLIVAQDKVGWVVRGENVNFFCPCSDKESALFVAHQTRNQWYPRARIVVPKTEEQDQ